MSVSLLFVHFNRAWFSNIKSWLCVETRSHQLQKKKRKKNWSMWITENWAGEKTGLFYIINVEF